MNEINDSQSTVKTMKQLVGDARERFERSSLTYRRAVHMREDDQQISDFELLNKHNDLIASRLGMVNALIDYRKSRAGLLSAGGGISLSFEKDARGGTKDRGFSQ